MGFSSLDWLTSGASHPGLRGLQLQLYYSWRNGRRKARPFQYRTSSDVSDGSHIHEDAALNDDEVVAMDMEPGFEPGKLYPEEEN